MPCPFSTALGIPGQGFHTHVAGLAILDVIFTILLAWATLKIPQWPYRFGTTLLLWFVLAEVLHMTFGVGTQVQTWLHLPSLCFASE